MRDYKTIILVFTFVMMSVSGGSAQRRFIIWSGDQHCGQKGPDIAPSELVVCSSVNTPRGRVSVLSHDGLTVSIAIVEDGDFLVLGTQLRNATQTVVQFDSDLWGAAHFKNINDPRVDVKPIAAETSVPYRDLVGGANASATKDSAIDVYLAGNSRTARTREVRRADGTRVRTTVLTPDEDAVRMADERVASRKTLANEEKQKYRNSPLSRKWLAPNTSAMGLVYFRRYKKAKLVVFSLKIHDTTYIFRLLRDQVSKDSK